MEQPDSVLGVELLRLTRRCRGIDKYVSSSAGLTIDEMHCLSVLFSEHPSSVKRLSELVNVNPTRLSKLLKVLEEKRFVVRKQHELDRRKELVVLTDTGTKEVQTILSLFAEVGSELIGGWRRELEIDFSWLLRTVSHPERAREGV